MKNIIRFILRLVQNPIVLAILWFGVAIRGFWVSWTEGLANNYLIFSRSFFHALEQTPLYVEYPKEYFDLFLYGIPFTLLIAPFSIMPTFDPRISEWGNPPAVMGRHGTLLFRGYAGK